MELINPKAEQYAKHYTSGLDVVLEEIETYTLTSHPHAQMLSGHVQGKVLELFSKMIAVLTRSILANGLGIDVGMSFNAVGS